MSRVLLLEPDNQLGDTYRQALETAGHQVVCCRDAQAAVDALGARKPEVIVTELQLARHNGVEFLYELRSYTDWQKLPVVVLSNVPPTERDIPAAAWQHMGIMDYLYKPLTRLEDLIRSVDNAVSAPA